MVMGIPPRQRGRVLYTILSGLVVVRVVWPPALHTPWILVSLPLTPTFDSVVLTYTSVKVRYVPNYHGSVAMRR